MKSIWIKINMRWILKKRSRIHHWSCSKLADKIRGVKKPFALEWDAWEEWHKEVKQKNPVRYWIAEELLDFLQDIVNLPMDIYHTIDIYVSNRYFSKLHYLPTGLKPGQYYDLDTRLLYGIFGAFVQFVEKEATVEHLEWASNLNYDGKPSCQAINATKALELYHWWKNREHRPDPMDESGWREYCDDKSFGLELTDEGKEKLDKLNELEEKYLKEDEDMMIELIKIRGSL